MKIDAYLVLEKETNAVTLKGESLDSAFAKALALTDFEFGSPSTEFDDLLNRSGTDKKFTAQYAKFGFSIDKELDRASPYLFQAYCLTYSGKVTQSQQIFARATVSFRKASGGEEPLTFLEMVFTGVVVVSYSVNFGEDGKGKESVGFRFKTCQLQYTPQTAEGTGSVPLAPRGWNYQLNTKIS
jgi:type VI protein secretion system component Hcp